MIKYMKMAEYILLSKQDGAISLQGIYGCNFVYLALEHLKIPNSRNGKIKHIVELKQNAVNTLQNYVVHLQKNQRKMKMLYLIVLLRMLFQIILIKKKTIKRM